MRTVLAVIRLSAFLVLTVLTIPVQMGAMFFGHPQCLPVLWHRTCCRIFGIRVKFSGRPGDGAEPVLYLCNHISYLDILVLGSKLKASFVAKSEVASWPGFGFLSTLQNTIFIERRKTAMEESRKKLADVLRAGRNVVLFGEGTSTDGRSVLPFKAGLLDALYEPGMKAKLQPVAIRLEKVGGVAPDDQSVRDKYGWWRPETTLVPHLWTFAKVWSTDVSVHFLPVLDPADYPDRKALAAAAHAGVLAVVAA